MTTPPLDLPAARKIAEEAAYDAPWTYKQGFKTGGARVANTSRFDLPGCFNCGENDGVYEETTARHIAAFDPPTVLALIARVVAAEAKVAAVRGLTDHYAALADSMPKPHGTVTRTQAIFVRDIHQALDHHTPETETTP